MPLAPRSARTRLPPTCSGVPEPKPAARLARPGPTPAPQPLGQSAKFGKNRALLQRVTLHPQPGVINMLRRTELHQNRLFTRSVGVAIGDLPHPSRTAAIAAARCSPSRRSPLSAKRPRALRIALSGALQPIPRRPGFDPGLNPSRPAPDLIRGGLRWFGFRNRSARHLLVCGVPRTGAVLPDDRHSSRALQILR